LTIVKYRNILKWRSKIKSDLFKKSSNVENNEEKVNDEQNNKNSNEDENSDEETRIKTEIDEAILYEKREEKR
jgi:hypothetical protein